MFWSDCGHREMNHNKRPNASHIRPFNAVYTDTIEIAGMTCFFLDTTPGRYTLESFKSISNAFVTSSLDSPAYNISEP
jgi:hypothetical protein